MMASIFDFPMAASESEERFRAGLGGRQAGQAKGAFGAYFSRFLVNGDAEDEERLGEMREIDRGLGRDVDLAHFQSPMSGITGFCLQGGEFLQSRQVSSSRRDF